MHLYLMRHGIAVEREEWAGPDEARPLTSEGRKKTKAIAKALQKNHGVAVDAILTSPLTRARETAETVAFILKSPVQQCDPLSDGADLGDVSAEVQLRGESKRLMLVGHEPDFGYLLAGLVGERQPRPFKKAGVAYLTGSFKKSGMKLKWQMTPKQMLGAD